MRLAIAVVALVLIVVAAVLLWPVASPTVNDATDDTIAWVRVSSMFEATHPGPDFLDAEDFHFVENTIRRGEYEGEAQTQSLLSTMSVDLGWSQAYKWRIVWTLTGPGDTELEDDFIFQKDLLAGRGTIQLPGGSDIFHLSEPGTYIVRAELFMHPFGPDDDTALEGVLASGVSAVVIPTEWAE